MNTPYFMPARFKCSVEETYYHTPLPHSFTMKKWVLGYKSLSHDLKPKCLRQYCVDEVYDRTAAVLWFFKHCDKRSGFVLRCMPFNLRFTSRCVEIFQASQNLIAKISKGRAV